MTKSYVDNNNNNNSFRPTIYTTFRLKHENRKNTKLEIPSLAKISMFGWKKCYAIIENNQTYNPPTKSVSLLDYPLGESKIMTFSSSENLNAHRVSKWASCINDAFCINFENLATYL